MLTITELEKIAKEGRTLAKNTNNIELSQQLDHLEIEIQDAKTKKGLLLEATLMTCEYFYYQVMDIIGNHTYSNSGGVFKTV